MFSDLTTYQASVIMRMFWGQEAWNIEAFCRAAPVHMSVLQLRFTHMTSIHNRLTLPTWAQNSLTHKHAESLLSASLPDVNQKQTSSWQQLTWKRKWNKSQSCLKHTQKHTTFEFLHWPNRFHSHAFCDFIHEETVHEMMRCVIDAMIKDWCGHPCVSDLCYNI